MIEEILNLKIEIEQKILTINDINSLEKFKLEFLVKKGKIQSFFDKLKEVPKEQKASVGKELNILRNYAEESFKNLKEKYEATQSGAAGIDVTLPGRRSVTGSFHPVLKNYYRTVQVFQSLGFSVAEGPDIEDDYHNFDALNFAKDHPARDMQDTFFIKSNQEQAEALQNLLLRTHTSPVQIRVMKGKKPPIRSIMPGRVYRNEAINARSLAEFYQIEGLYIDKKVTFAELKATLMLFARKLYGENSDFRFRPSYFPFTEPSAELDISCFLCGGKGCRICKHSGWLEIAGCGMVHPNVLKECDIDPEEYSGYAFGFGIERVTLLQTGIDDIRLLYDNDIRVISQF